jgi:hypothetical protein
MEKYNKIVDSYYHQKSKSATELFTVLEWGEMFEFLELLMMGEFNIDADRQEKLALLCVRTMKKSFGK